MDGCHASATSDDDGADALSSPGTDGVRTAVGAGPAGEAKGAAARGAAVAAGAFGAAGGRTGSWVQAPIAAKEASASRSVPHERSATRGLGITVG